MNQSELDPQPVVQSYRLIPLTQGQFAIVDQEDFDWLNQWKWCASWSPDSQSFYAMRMTNEGGKRTSVYMAREIKHAPKGVLVDHVSRVTLDNRRFNLRFASKGDNQHNQKKRKTNTSGFKGVSWDSVNNKWVAQIQINWKNKKLGRFDNIEDAAEAYRQAARQLHGEFASF